MMKTLALLLVTAISAIAQSPTPWPIVAVKDVTPAGVIVTGDYNAGNVAAFLRDRPEFTDKVLAIIAGQLDASDELLANKRVDALTLAGVTLPKAVTDKHAARITKFARQKEAALMKVKDTDPVRAKTRLDELLAAKIPIAQSVQDAVAKAQPVSAPAPTPSATPADGL